MKCNLCGRRLLPGQNVIPVMTVRESSRYDPAPDSQPSGYIHTVHFDTKEFS